MKMCAPVESGALWRTQLRRHVRLQLHKCEEIKFYTEIYAEQEEALRFYAAVEVKCHQRKK